MSNPQPLLNPERITPRDVNGYISSIFYCGLFMGLSATTAFVALIHSLTEGTFSPVMRGLMSISLFILITLMVWAYKLFTRLTKVARWLYQIPDETIEGEIIND